MIPLEPHYLHAHISLEKKNVHIQLKWFWGRKIFQARPISFSMVQCNNRAISRYTSDFNLISSSRSSCKEVILKFFKSIKWLYCSCLLFAIIFYANCINTRFLKKILHSILKLWLQINYYFQVSKIISI